MGARGAIDRMLQGVGEAHLKSFTLVTYLGYGSVKKLISD